MLISYIRDWVGARGFGSSGDDTMEDRTSADTSSGHSQNCLVWCPFLICIL